MSRVLITGASGFLGHVLCEEIAAAHEVFSGWKVHRPESRRATPIRIDVTDERSIRAAFTVAAPDTVVHAAAIASPDRCESEPGEAVRVNSTGSAFVAKACADAGCRLILVSTDLVFDGSRGRYTEQDPVRPINVYSRTKVEAEKSVSGIVPGVVVLRVPLLYGWGPDSHPGMVRQMLALWREGKTSRLFLDQYRTPAHAPQVARVIEALIGRPEVRGTFHVGGADRISRLEFGRMVARASGFDQRLLLPASMDEVPGPAPRAADCSLVSTYLAATLGVQPLGCREGIDRLFTAHPVSR